MEVFLNSVFNFFQWNGHGYDVAKIFGAKFSAVSPVWLQIVRKSAGEFAVNGGHDIDKGNLLYDQTHLPAQLPPGQLTPTHFPPGQSPSWKIFSEQFSPMIITPLRKLTPPEILELSFVEIIKGKLSRMGITQSGAY